jgi:hypothetical protein
VEPSITTPDAVPAYLLQSLTSYNWLQDQYSDLADLELSSTEFGKFFSVKIKTPDFRDVFREVKKKSWFDLII